MKNKTKKKLHSFSFPLSCNGQKRCLEVTMSSGDDCCCYRKQGMEMHIPKRHTARIAFNGNKMCFFF